MAGKRRRHSAIVAPHDPHADTKAIDEQLADENALRRKLGWPELSLETLREWQRKTDEVNAAERAREVKAKRKVPAARTREPLTVIEDELRERTGIVLTHVAHKLRSRAKRPIDPVELWHLLGIAERTIAGLVDVSQNVLTDPTGKFAAWRTNYGKQHKWHAEQLRTAAMLVGYLRALGYKRGMACELAQERLLKLGFDDSRTLAKKLEREHRNGIFSQWSFLWPSRAEARTVLERDFGDAARKLPDGPLPERTTPPSPIAIRYEDSGELAAVLVPGHNRLWWPAD